MESDNISNKLITELISRLEAEIVRLGVDYASIGSVDCIVVIYGGVVEEDEDDGTGFHYSYTTGIELADDHWFTADLNVLATLDNLAKLPDNAGYDAFWSCVVDMDGCYGTNPNYPYELYID